MTCWLAPLWLSSPSQKNKEQKQKGQSRWLAPLWLSSPSGKLSCWPRRWLAPVGVGVLLLLLCWPGLVGQVQARPAIQLTFHWHLHQPIYWPYENVVQTINKSRYGFPLLQVFTDRSGPYTGWPVDAAESASKSGLSHCGAQVSFSGSLIENLNNLEAAGKGFSGWKNRWRWSRQLKTSLGNPRLDLVSFGYHHPLMALTGPKAMELQIKMHRLMQQKHFGIKKPSSGMFPPENAFSVRMIPALVQAGIKWVMVDNIHFDRAHVSYPYVKQSNLMPPNRADQRNKQKTSWVQLRDLWAPSKVAAPFGYRPYYVEYVEPSSGKTYRIIVVPTARYEGNEDGRGGFGALNYEKVLSQYEAQNTDDKRPMLVVLHHDGDNYGGGTDSYYKSNFGRFLSWARSNSKRFECTTVEDYLKRFPPAPTDVIHVEDGSWSGADNGDPEFAKWNGDPDKSGYSPDRNSWSVMTAARNRVLTAEALAPQKSLENIIAGKGSSTELAWHFFLNGETSCYWYWDRAQGGIWDAHPTRAANMAVRHADKVIAAAGGRDPVAPTIYLPQREPYNPGGIEWKANKPMPSDFTVWTYVYDLSGLKRVVLRYRVSTKLTAPERANMVYAGGSWKDLAMKASRPAPQTNPKPTWQAALYQAEIKGVQEALVDYYVEAEDKKGQVSRSPILHVYVGNKTGTTPGQGPWSPQNPCINDTITIYASRPGELHWGVNGWKLPDAAYWPPQSKPFGDNKAVDTPLSGPDAKKRYVVRLGPFNNPAQSVQKINFVFHYADGTWSKPDQTISLRSSCTPNESPAEQPAPEPPAERPGEKHGEKPPSSDDLPFDGPFPEPADEASSPSEPAVDSPDGGPQDQPSATDEPKKEGGGEVQGCSCQSRRGSSRRDSLGSLLLFLFLLLVARSARS